MLHSGSSTHSTGVDLLLPVLRLGWLGTIPAYGLPECVEHIVRVGFTHTALVEEISLLLCPSRHIVVAIAEIAHQFSTVRGAQSIRQKLYIVRGAHIQYGTREGVGILADKITAHLDNDFP